VRILTVGNLYPPEHLGGYELVWQATVRALRGHGHDVRVLCTNTLLTEGAAEQDADVHRELRCTGATTSGRGCACATAARSSATTAR